jgi:biotin carboxylase
MDRFLPHSAGFLGFETAHAGLKRVLVLFVGGWDHIAYTHARHHARYAFHFEGFDLFSFPGNARLLTFNLLHFAERMAAKYRGRIDAVVSNNEQFGALAASLIAKKLGLPGLSPLPLLLAQHKFYMRERLAEHIPEAMPRYCTFPYTFNSREEIALEFPFFVKPVKAAYSVLARRVENYDELRQHLDFHPWEKYIIKRLVRPFNDACRALTDFSIDAHHLVGESLLQGEQINIDGLVFDGQIHILGIVDAVMYPGTLAFMRWDYPSRLPSLWQERAAVVARKAIAALDYDHGFFNVEMTVDRQSGDIKIIEINPRMASQFSDMYAKVDGIDLHDIGIDMALGHIPNIEKKTMPCSCAASFVLRKFTLENLPCEPAHDRVEWLKRFDPDAILTTFIKQGGQLKREMKWLGSYRYAVLNMGAENEAALMEKFGIVRSKLGFCG